MNEGHHSAISRFILGLSSVRVSVRLPVCTRVNILLLCRLSASCHSWTAHEHICQCHEVEPFPARACNLFHFPWVFGLLHKSLWKCRMQKKKKQRNETGHHFLRGYKWGAVDSELTWMHLFICRNWSWIASCSTLTDRICAGSRTCGTPWPTALRLWWVRFPWDQERSGDDGRAGEQNGGMHFESTKYVNLFLKG